MSDLGYSTLREKVVSVLRESILKGEFENGEKINEVDLSQKFGISRGPVREALRQIEQEGLVKYTPNKGCTIQMMTKGSVYDMFLIRSTLECLAVKMFDGKMREEKLAELEDVINDMTAAAMQSNLAEFVKYDEKFHSMIVEEARSERLSRIWKSLEGENVAIFYTLDHKMVMSYKYVRRNHMWIVDDLKSQDTDKICVRIQEHYLSSVGETHY